MTAAEVGAEIVDFVELDFGTPQVIDGKVQGQVVYVDSFGNLVTNISSEVILNFFKCGDVLHICGTSMPLVDTYASVEKGAPLAVVGSHGYLEISVNSGSAARLLRLESGDGIEIGGR